MLGPLSWLEDQQVWSPWRCMAQVIWGSLLSGEGGLTAFSCHTLDPLWHVCPGHPPPRLLRQRKDCSGQGREGVSKKAISYQRGAPVMSSLCSRTPHQRTFSGLHCSLRLFLPFLIPFINVTLAFGSEGYYPQ